MNEKLKYILLSGTLLLISTLSASAQGNNVVYVDENIMVSQGNTIMVPIMIHNATGVSAVDVNLVYNASVVNVTYASPGDFDFHFKFNNGNAANGSINIKTFKIGPPLTGNLTIANITLDATGRPGELSALGMEILVMSDDFGKDVPGTVKNGSILVSEIKPPSVTNPSANPPLIPNNGTTSSRLNVTVTDESGIASVSIDLSPIGGPSHQPMTRSSDVWTYTLKASGTAGIFYLQVNATDVWGNSNTSVAIPVRIIEPALLNIGSLSTSKGKSITVPIMINNATDVACVGLNLSYDPGVVNITGASMGDFTFYFGADTSNAAMGWVTVNTFISGTQLSGDLVAARITLEPVGNGGDTTQLIISDVIMTDKYTTPLPVAIDTGYFSINMSSPVLDPIGNRSVDEGALLEFTITSSDVDGDILTYSASNLPPGAFFDPSNQTFSWTPGFDASGIYPEIHFEVNDGEYIDSENITITVNNVNRAPGIQKLSDQSGKVGVSWTYDISVLISDPDNDPLTIQTDDSNISIDGYELTFSYSIPVKDKKVLITVTDASLSDNQTIYVTAVENTAPVLSAPFAYPDIIPDDTDKVPMWGETSILNITAVDDSGIGSITMDLSPIGGSSSQPMVNIGGNIWSVSTNASAGTPPGIYDLQVNATDIYGNSNTSMNISITVMRNGDTNQDNIVNIADAMLLTNHLSDPDSYTLSAKCVADVTGDGGLNLSDATLLANHVSYPGGGYILQ